MFINYDFLASIHISIVITFFVNSCSKIETQYKSSFACIIQVICCCKICLEEQITK